MATNAIARVAIEHANLDEPFRGSCLAHPVDLHDAMVATLADGRSCVQLHTDEPNCRATFELPGVVLELVDDLTRPIGGPRVVSELFPVDRRPMPNVPGPM